MNLVQSLRKCVKFSSAIPVSCLHKRSFGNLPTLLTKRLADSHTPDKCVDHAREQQPINNDYIK